MRRFGVAVLVLLLVVSLAGNGVLGWAAWRAQKEYRALAQQFVKTRQQLAAVSPVKVAPPVAAPAVAATPSVVPATAPAAAPAVAATAGGGATEAGIQAKYTPRLEAVQVECEGQLNAMLESAKAEYAQAKKAGGTVDVAALGARYLARADGLRRQCDRQVDSVTKEMAADLRAAGLPLDLVDEVKAAYEARIVERQAEIMAKAPAN